MQKDTVFLSCDWGTSAFRLRLVETAGATVIASESSPQGIAHTFEQWQQSRQPENLRLSFYLGFMKAAINNLERQANAALQEVPVVVSGMASSTIGMMDIPYKHLPFSLDGANLQVQRLQANADFNHNMLIISGVRTADDVMRGEETKMVGCVAPAAGEALFILPGTHAKHIWVKDNTAVAFKTYMTGELFSLLSKKSVLATSVEEGHGLTHGNNLQRFEKGVRDSTKENLLHNIFLVRTNQVFQTLTRQENYYYLSGLLIGTELKEIVPYKVESVTIVSNAALLPYYEAACGILNAGRHYALHTQQADEALVKGQVKVLRNS